MFEINERVGRPEPLPDFIPSHDLPGAAQQHFEDQVRLTTKFYLRIAFGKLTRTRVYFERAEAVLPRRFHATPNHGYNRCEILSLLPFGPAGKQLFMCHRVNNSPTIHPHFTVRALRSLHLCKTVAPRWNAVGAGWRGVRTKKGNRELGWGRARLTSAQRSARSMFRLGATKQISHRCRSSPVSDDFVDRRLVT